MVLTGLLLRQHLMSSGRDDYCPVQMTEVDVEVVVVKGFIQEILSIMTIRRRVHESKVILDVWTRKRPCIRSGPEGLVLLHDLSLMCI